MTTGATPLSPALARAAAPVAPTAPAPGSITVPAHALPVQAGQALAARVLAVAGGQVELALAGGRVSAQTSLPLVPGQTVELVVREAAEDKVTLRLATPSTATGQTGTTPAPVTPQSVMEDAGLPASAARSVLAALAQTGAAQGTPADMTRLAQRALDAGVKTPADAAAFVRLESQGLPTTPAAVRGLATLLEGSPIGRTLTGLLGDAGAAARPPAGSPAPAASSPATAGPAPGAQPPAAATPAPLGAPLPGGTSPAPAASPTPGVAQTIAVPMPTAPGDTAVQEPAVNWPPQRPIGQPTPGADSSTSPTARQASPQAPGLGELVSRLTLLADSIADGAVSGDPAALRGALRELGHGVEAELLRGELSDKDSLRARLHELASRPGPESLLARTAERLADAVAAQALAGPTLPGSEQTSQGTQNQGVYLQVPLPGGQSAEVRVNPDAQGEGPDGEERARRIAFLLHLSALGPVLIEANHGPRGTEAIVRVTSSGARAYLAERASELAEGLRRSADEPDRVRVSVERFAGPAPTRLLPAPPPTGLDFQV